MCLHTHLFEFLAEGIDTISDDLYLFENRLYLSGCAWHGPDRLTGSHIKLE